MFLVKDNRHGTTYLVFTWEDPRKAGFKGVTEEVTLDFDMEKVYQWPDGSECPEVRVGQDPAHPEHLKVFKYASELQEAGYRSVEGDPVVFGSWGDYLKLHFFPPDPEGTDDVSWYDYLDRLDKDSRLRRQRLSDSSEPTGTTRDEVAEWVAKKHLIADSHIQQIWYLPKDASPEEIRLLELNDILAGISNKVEAIDFGLDVDGSSFKLLVADVTSEQLEQIKQDASQLPQGWSIDGRKIWRRGA